MTIAEVIAEALKGELFHPGDGQDQAPMRIASFRVPAGAPPELKRQVDLSAQLIAEAIVQRIEVTHDIVPKQQETQ